MIGGGHIATGVVLLATAVALAIPAAGLVLAGVSGLEADSINVGSLLGLETNGLRLGTIWAGIGVAVVAAASMAAGLRAVLLGVTVPALGRQR